MTISAGLSPLKADELPRPEYPRPQFARTDWQNLNGKWSYTFDFGKSGMEDKFYESTGFEGNIIVPFCPESSLSGVGHKDFIEAMWYQRTIHIPAEWEGKHIILHFGGSDWETHVYIDGQETAVHYGGACSFAIDITKYVKAGTNHNLVVGIRDDVRSRLQPSGKQSRRRYAYECFYTRVTGIWQTVWMEPVSYGGLKECRITPDLDNSQFVLQPVFYETDIPAILQVTIKDGSKAIFKKEVNASNSSLVVAPIKKVKTWSPESPFLYGVEYIVKDAAGRIIDKVEAYAGMRKAELRNGQFFLNNRPYYQRLVLDQGYYPDGQWTAPTDEALKHDIEMSKRAGFNGARLHQKVFEQRYFYWADHLGYLTWGESPSWEMDWTNPIAARNMITEWEECIARDYNEPCLVCWSPLNETWMPDHEGNRARLTNELYYITKRLDPTRPVVTTSGGYHCGHTDIYAEHTYQQDPVALYNQLKLDENGMAYYQHQQFSTPWQGETYMIDEFGGIRWVKKMKAEEVAPEEQFWGYGRDPQSLEEYYRRLEDQVNVILSLDHIAGFCYTQITDVELEKNGIYTYDREEKFDMERIRSIFSKPRQQAKAEVKEMLERSGNRPPRAD